MKGVRITGRRLVVAAEAHIAVTEEVVYLAGHLARLFRRHELGDGLHEVALLIGGFARLECFLIHDCIAPICSTRDRASRYAPYYAMCSMRMDSITSPARSFSTTSLPSTVWPNTVYPESSMCWGPRQK